MIANNIEWWVVNLESRPDRLIHATEQFAQHQIPFRRFVAFTPDEWPGSQLDVNTMRSRTPGAIGCHQSQLHVMRTAQGENRTVGICEDDVVFCEDLPQRLNHIAKFCNTHEWDIFWLGGTFHLQGDPECVWHPDGKQTEPTDDPRIRRTYGIWSTYAYLVNGRSVRKILEICDEHVHESIGIDYLAIKWLEPELKTYCFVPGCARQYNNRSDIGNGITEFSHFANLGPHWYQDRREDFDPLTYSWEYPT